MQYAPHFDFKPVTAEDLDPATTDAAGPVELATTAEVDTGTDTTRAITPAGAAAVYHRKDVVATDTVAGIVELATTAEVTGGTNTTKAVTPAGAAAAYVPTTVEIGDAEDLNNYTTTGTFFQESNTFAENGSNYPTDLAGSLQVIGYNDFITQIYTRYAGAGNPVRQYIRTGRLDTNNWLDWRQVYHHGNLVTATTTIEGLVKAVTDAEAIAETLGAGHAISPANLGAWGGKNLPYDFTGIDTTLANFSHARNAVQVCFSQAFTTTRTLNLRVRIDLSFELTTADGVTHAEVRINGGAWGNKNRFYALAGNTTDNGNTINAYFPAVASGTHTIDVRVFHDGDANTVTYNINAGGTQSMCVISSTN